MIRSFPPADAELNGDAFWTYLPNARRLLEDPWRFLTTDPSSFFVAPLGYVWPAIWGADPVYTQLANAVLFLFSILLMWRMSVKIGGMLAGMIATALLVFYPELHSYIPQVLTESIFLFGLLLFLNGATDYVLAHSHPTRALAWATTGLSITLMSRPVLQLFTLGGLLCVIAILIVTKHQKRSKNPIARPALAVALSVALLLPAAIIVKNGLSFSYWGLGTGAGAGLFYGVSPFKMGMEPIYGGFEYDAGITPLIADPTTQGAPLHPRSDAILSKVAIDIVKNTTVKDNVYFFWFKLKAWLFFSIEDVRMHSKVRLLRTVEWLSILVAICLIGFSIRRTNTAAGLRLAHLANLLPNHDGYGLRRLGLFVALLVFVLAMAAQLTPLLYNLRYNLFFLEPMLIPLCGISIAMLLSARQSHKFNQRQRFYFWGTRIVALVVLIYLPFPLTAYAKRHSTWGMDPYRPGPTTEALGKLHIGPPIALGAEPSGKDAWTTTERGAALKVPLTVNTPLNFTDGIWRLKLGVLPKTHHRHCRKVRLEVINPVPLPPVWYTPKPVINVQADGQLHLYALHANRTLRPGQSGYLLLHFDCPVGTKISWGGAQLLEVTLPQAAQALIQNGVPINPYRDDDIR